ncbi:MAG: ATP-binding protein [Peptostreptococcaceae bacterium]
MNIPSIYNKIKDYIMILNKEYEIIFCNKSLLSRLDYNEEQILNTNTAEIINSTNIDKLKITKEINEIIELYTKSKQSIKIKSNITLETFKNEEYIIVVGEEVQDKSYNMEMLEEILDNVNAVIFLTNSKGKYLYVNDAFTKLVDKKREDIIGTYNKNHWPKSVYEVLDKNNNEIFEIQSPKIFNEKVKMGENNCWYESYKAPIFDENKKPKYVVGIAQDVNLSKIVSEELYKHHNVTIVENYLKNKDESCLNLNKILEKIGENILNYTQASGMSILLYDEDKQGFIPSVKLKKANEYMKNVDLIPLSKEELLSNKYGKNLNCMFKAEQIPNVELLNNDCLDELQYSSNYSIELYNEFIGIICLSYDKGEEPKFNSDEYMKYICNKIAMIIKNIRLSYAVAIENKKRRYTEKELERYLQISVDLVAILGKNGYLKRISPNWINVLGWSEEELLSMPIIEIMHPEELAVFKDKIEDQFEDGKITRNIIRFRRKDGEYIFLEWSSEYISEEEEYITTARDLTTNLEIEKEKRKLEEAVQLEVVRNEFFSNISHEFRTPINIILGTMQVINKNIENDNLRLDNLKKYTNYIKQNSYRLLRLVNNLIDISKMDIGMYELRCSNQNIISIIEDITLSVADYTKENMINLIFDTDNEEVITYCDPDKIERIMLNILSNAIKYTKENGCIKVIITTEDDYITVSIKDNGIGIPKDKLDIIFDRFGQVEGSFNRKHEGSGIGLSLVKNLVEMHGGNINVISEINKGAEFIFSIPIRTEEINNLEYDRDRKCKHVERCDIEFSDIYSM